MIETTIGRLVATFITFICKRIIKQSEEVIASANETEKYITIQAPPVNEEFSYRDDTVKKLYKEIKKNRKLALINGLGGIGKTTIAKALYHKVKGEYKHIAWVEYQHNIKESLLNSFNLFKDVEDVADRYEKIENFLLSARKNTIIFIDNVSAGDSEGLDFMERLSVNVVLTSRLDRIGNYKKFPVDFLSLEQCVDIFYKYYEYDKTRKQEEAARKLVLLVKCHTLSVELLARTANRPGYPLAKFLTDLKEKGFDYSDLDVEISHNANSTTIAGHLQALFEMASVSDEQKRILKNFSIMPSIEMPAEVQEWLGCSSNDIVGLTNLGWLSASETGYEMHPVIKESIRLQYKEIQYEDFAAVINYMSGDDFIKDTDVYTKAHFRLNIAESVMSYLCNIEKEEIGRLFNNIAFVYRLRGNYPKALEWYQKALVIDEKVLGLEHPNTAIRYNNIAAVYDNQGDYPKALEWYQKALVIDEKVLGLEHPNTAIKYNNIAGVYESQGDYHKALKLYQKALVIDEKVLGLEHPNTAIRYNNIAGVYKSQGDYPKALELYQKALVIDEKVLGLEHPNTAIRYNNIAAVYESQGDCPKALELYQKSLVIREKVLGLQHPYTISVNKSIARVRMRQGTVPCLS